MAELHTAGLPTSVLEVVAAKVVVSVFLTHLFLFSSRYHISDVPAKATRQQEGFPH